MIEIESEPPHDFTALIERERAALLDVLKSIRSGDWSKPTACPGWTVHDLALHILGTDIGVISRQRDGFHGTPGPSGATDAALEAFVDGLNHDWVSAMRRTSPELTSSLLRASGRDLVDFYRITDPTVRDAYVSWASTQPVPRWFDHARELTERWVHHQQILEAVGASPWLEPDMTTVVLDTFARAYPFRLSQLHRPDETTAAVDITGEVTLRWRWVSRDNSWEAAPEGAPAETLLTMSTSMAWRLLTNGLPPVDWPEAMPGHDSAVARTLVRTRAIIGTPNG